MLPKPDILRRDAATRDATRDATRGASSAVPSGDTGNVGDPVTRRGFLQAGVIVGGALLISFRLPAARGAQSAKAEFSPNAFIRIDAGGKVTLIMPQAEMGQGIFTAVAMILAEELDAAFDQVTLEAAPPNDKLYANPVFGIQVTGNSNSVRSFWLTLRKAAAGARAILVQAAAQTWKVEPSSIRTADGEAIHDASGRRLDRKSVV